MDALCLLHDVDKSSAHHGYTRQYPACFQPYFDKPVRYLEIGVLYGSSLRAIRELLPAAERIVGVDISPSCKAQENPSRNIFVEIGDVRDVEFMKRVNDVHGPFDIILDDGSHRCSDVIAGFELMFPLLADGGLYIVEDTNVFNNVWWKDVPGTDHLSYFGGLARFLNVQGRNFIADPFKVAKTTTNPIEYGLDGIDFRCGFIALHKLVRQHWVEPQPAPRIGFVIGHHATSPEHQNSLRQCVQSLREHSPDAAAVIVVIDGGSLPVPDDVASVCTVVVKNPFEHSREFGVFYTAAHLPDLFPGVLSPLDRVFCIQDSTQQLRAFTPGELFLPISALWHADNTSFREFSSDELVRKFILPKVPSAVARSWEAHLGSPHHHMIFGGMIMGSPALLRAVWDTGLEHVAPVIKDPTTRMSFERLLAAAVVTAGVSHPCVTAHRRDTLVGLFDNIFPYIHLAGQPRPQCLAFAASHNYALAKIWH